MKLKYIYKFELEIEGVKHNLKKPIIAENRAEADKLYIAWFFSKIQSVTIEDEKKTDDKVLNDLKNIFGCK